MHFLHILLQFIVAHIPHFHQIHLMDVTGGGPGKVAPTPSPLDITGGGPG